MRVAVTGSNGLVGAALAGALHRSGHTVVHVVRRPSPAAVPAASGGVTPGAVGAPAAAREEASWDPVAGTIDASALRNLDAVLHLAGAPISLRWTRERKALMRHSRVKGTELIARALAGLDARPRVLVCASAYGYYGDRGDELLTEDSPPGRGFLAELATQWEAAAQPARDAGVRVVHARFGVVLAPDADALRQIKKVFQTGLGGRLGSGNQWWPWIAIEDAVAALRFVLERETVSGPLNVVSPGMVTNAGLARTLGKVLTRPSFVSAPGWALRCVFGEAAPEMLLASQRVVPAKLQQAGFQWALPDLEPALRLYLRRHTRDDG